LRSARVTRPAPGCSGVNPSCAKPGANSSTAACSCWPCPASVTPSAASNCLPGALPVTCAPCAALTTFRSTWRCCFWHDVWATPSSRCRCAGRTRKGARYVSCGTGGAC
jgi:hypothetical protein